MDTAISWVNQLPLLTIPFLIKLCVALVIMIITKMITKGLSSVLHDVCKRNNLDDHTSLLISKVVRYVVTIFGTTVALQNLGIEMSMLLTLFGITGIVLSYGMKDIVANFIAGVLILGYKHIKLNDHIKTSNWQGTVVDMNLRYVTLQHENMTIFIPNIVLYTQTVAIIHQ